MGKRRHKFASRVLALGAAGTGIAAIVTGGQLAAGLLEAQSHQLDVTTVSAVAIPTTVPLVADDPSIARPPSSITIDDILLWAPVRPVGLDTNGNLEIPNESEVGWYVHGGTPGNAGATVLVGHVTWNQTVGPFHLLSELEPGAHIQVRSDEHGIRTYEVLERTTYDKDELPADRIWRSTGSEELVLITCGGAFDSQVRRYLENVVVYAVPIA